MGSGDGESAGRVVAAPAGAFQVDFGPGVEIAVYLQRGVAFVTADETGGESEGAAGGAEEHGEVAAGAFPVVKSCLGGGRRANYIRENRRKTGPPSAGNGNSDPKMLISTGVLP